jgi:hypothetical protein
MAWLSNQMNRQDAKDAKKRKREKTKTYYSQAIPHLIFEFFFSLFLFLASLASWRFI